MRWGPHRRLSLKAMMRRSVRLASRPGLWWGRQERSSMGWPARYRPTHRLAVAGETWKRSAARRTGQPSSTTRRARRRRPSGVSGALAWVMKASGQRCECVNPHHAGGLHTTSPLFTTSQGSTASTFRRLHVQGINASDIALRRSSRNLHLPSRHDEVLVSGLSER